ncbi:MAG: hypothetical protein LBU79_06960 [Planctomycetota bacterium]|jgi:hypothetical protein|nr:hypothetical protein [Planctomycetota bacterium]
MDLNIRNSVLNKGLNSIDDTQSNIAKALEGKETLTQTEYIHLQQDVQAYTNMISLMSNILKGLSDTDKEVIRNT